MLTISLSVSIASRGALRVLALGDRVPQPGARIGRGLDAHLAGQQARFLGEGREPVSVVSDPLVDLGLVDQRGAVGLGLDHDRQMTNPRVTQHRERTVIRVAGL